MFGNEQKLRDEGAMKVFTLFMACVLAMAVWANPVVAQEPPNTDSSKGERREGAKPKGERREPGARLEPGALAEQLGLDNEQKKKLAEITRELREKLRDMRGSNDRQAAAQLRQQFERRINEFLTPDQREKWAQQRRQGGAETGPRAPGAAETSELLERVKTVLVLSKDDQAKVLPLVEKVLEARRALQTLPRHREALLGFLREGGTDEQIEAKLNEYRQRRDELEGNLNKAQAELTAAVDKEALAKLVALDILR